MKDITLTLEGKKEISPSVYELVLRANESLPPIKCGQFMHIKVGGEFLLRRPFCIYKYTDTTVTIAVAVVGGGTKRLVGLNVGEKLNAILPIGNGFTLNESHKKVVLLGGGVGCAPLVSVPVTYPGKEYYCYIGFTDKSTVAFENDFLNIGKTVLCTDNGTAGRKGYVTDVLYQDIENIKPDIILTCGSTPMLKAAAMLSAKTKIPAYMSGETRMGCGVGACLVCACALRGKNGETVHKRACVDGPVFNLEDIIW